MAHRFFFLLGESSTSPFTSHVRPWLGPWVKSSLQPTYTLRLGSGWSCSPLSTTSPCALSEPWRLRGDSEPPRSAPAPLAAPLPLVSRLELGWARPPSPAAVCAEGVSGGELRNARFLPPGSLPEAPPSANEPPFLGRSEKPSPSSRPRLFTAAASSLSAWPPSPLPAAAPPLPLDGPLSCCSRLAARCSAARQRSSARPRAARSSPSWTLSWATTSTSAPAAGRAPSCTCRWCTCCRVASAAASDTVARLASSATWPCAAYSSATRRCVAIAATSALAAAAAASSSASSLASASSCLASGSPATAHWNTSPGTVVSSNSPAPPPPSLGTWLKPARVPAYSVVPLSARARHVTPPHRGALKRRTSSREPGSPGDAPADHCHCATVPSAPPEYSSPRSSSCASTFTRLPLP
mmetsp:Transcript_10600/g.36847  ORF Transcript_10600/g.36847 Transcript_10600/m.36847 type:complete len:410 (-) Transcript_10600:222-1451(-)